MPNHKKAGLRMAAAILSVMLLPSLFPVIQADSGRQGEMPDYAVLPGGVTANPPFPEVGATVTITVQIWNLGTTFGSVNYTVYDIGVGGQSLIGQGRADVATGSGLPTEKSVSWDTTGLPGQHTIGVVLSDGDPQEFQFGNNNVTLDIVVFNPTYDLIVKGNESRVISSPYNQQGFVLVQNFGTLTLSGAAFSFSQQRDFQYFIRVADSAQLVIERSTVSANLAAVINIGGNGTVRITSSTVRLGIDGGGKELTVKDSTLDGPLFNLSSRTVGIASSSLNGSAFRAQYNSVSLTGTEAISSSAFRIVSSVVDSVNSSYRVVGQEGAPENINVSGSSEVNLTNVSTGSIGVNDRSLVRIYRWLEVFTSDRTGVALRNAAVDVKDYFTNASRYALPTDSSGRVLFRLETEQITPYGVGVTGHYQLYARYDTPTQQYATWATPVFAQYPALEPADNHLFVNITFPILVPKAGLPVKLPSAISSAYTVSGDIVVDSAVSLASALVWINQDRDFQYGFYVQSGGELTVSSSNISSNRAFNLYISGTGRIEGSGLALGASYIVARDQASVRLGGLNTGASINLEGTGVDFSVLGTSTLGGPVTTSKVKRLGLGGTTLALPTGSLDISATEVSIEGSLISVRNLTVSATTVNVIGTNLSTGSMNITASGSLLLQDSTVMAEGRASVRGATLNAIDTVFSMPLQFADRDLGFLTNVSVPSVSVRNSASVTRYWRLTVGVIDRTGESYPGTVSAEFASNGTPYTSTELVSGIVRVPLIAETITSSGSVFIGNYRVKVSVPKPPSIPYAPPDGFTATTQVSLDDNRELSFTLPWWSPPSRVRFSGLVMEVRNGTVVYPDNFTVTGNAQYEYKNGDRHGVNGGTVNVEVLSPGGKVTRVSTTTLTDFGYFTVAVPIPIPELFNENDTVTISIHDPLFNLTWSEKRNVTVRLREPAKMVVKFDVFRITAKGQIPLTNATAKINETILIRGTAYYDIGDGIIRFVSGKDVYFEVKNRAIGFQTKTDSNGNFSKQYRLTYTGSYTFDVKVVAFEEVWNATYAGTGSFPVNVPTPIVVKTTPPPPYAIIALVVVIGAVAGVAGLLFYLQRGVEKMVECGQCGELIPESAKRCPRCNTEFEEDIVKCSECEAWIPSSAMQCPKCGAAFKKTLKGGEAAPAAEAAGGPGAPPPEQPPAGP